MDFNKLMQQAQEMQRQMGRIEEELQATEYIGSAGGDGVTVKVNGGLEVLEVNIDEELLEKDNREMLQDMILIAVNDALDQASQDRQDKLGVMTQGMNIPGIK
ncbi:MAG: YbaB/EbfC family nucleoid-associated protein [Solobacterium sp.]|nr:YbaB/EbfC family nucleoid-associated protein [Solobacterium sp.]MBR2830348.1 YbaB/EbfC family nucleoid-associated protein [Solobacterium sp.]